MDQSHDIKKHVRTYVGVFITLLALTMITVAVSYLHLEIHEAVTIALLVAVVKGGLVASFLIHQI
jgi:caa(3)-type oxidase subunit IV